MRDEKPMSENPDEKDIFEIGEYLLQQEGEMEVTHEFTQGRELANSRADVGHTDVMMGTSPFQFI